ncbi:hypothetical protein PROFUN_16465, partial [Planoprotostelium fungivorum]
MRVVDSACSRDKHVSQMIQWSATTDHGTTTCRLLCLWLLFHLISTCEIYVDGDNGIDSPSCGSLNSPCKTITNNVKNLSLCISSGEYEPPVVRCTGIVRSDCRNDSKHLLKWENVTIRDCFVNWTASCLDVQITSSSLIDTHIYDSVSYISSFHRLTIPKGIEKIDQLIISHSHLHRTHIILLTSDGPLRFDGNIINASRIYIFSESRETSGNRSILIADNSLHPNSFLYFSITSHARVITIVDLINNTDVLFESIVEPISPDASSVYIEWDLLEGDEELVDLNPIRLNLLENRMFDFGWVCHRSPGVPHINLTRNKITSINMSWTDALEHPRLNSSLITFDDNEVWTLKVVADNGEGRVRGHIMLFVFQQNLIHEIFLHSPYLSHSAVDFRHNTIGNVVLSKSSIEGDEDYNDIFTKNLLGFVIFWYTYPSFQNNTNTLHMFNNEFFVIELLVSFPSNRFPAQIVLKDNIWYNAFKPTQDATGLRVTSFMCDVHLINSTFQNYSGGAINIYSERSSVVIDSVSVSECKGGISISSDISNIHISNSNISHNSDRSEGGLSLYGSHNNVTIYNCTLFDNESPHGSAIASSMKMSHIDMKDMIVRAQKAIEHKITDYSTVVIYGSHKAGNNSMTCGEERYMDVSESADSLMWSCRPCDNGMYIIGRGMMREDKTSKTDCKPCSSGAECQFGLTPQAKGRYWCGVNDKEELQCLLCPSDYCKKESHNWHDSCLGNREGVLCGTCAANYTLGFFTSSCLPTSECKSQWMALFCIIPIFYFIILVLLPIGDGSIWKSTSYFIQTVPLLIGQGQRNQVISILASIFLNPSTTTGLFRGVCIGQVDYVEMQMLSLYIPLATLFVLSLACIFLYIYQKVQERYTIYTQGYSTLIMMESTDNNGIEEESRENSTGEKRTVMSRCTAGLITAFLLIYGGLVSTCLKLLFCVQLESSGWVLYNAGSISCDQPWRILLIILSGLFLIPSPLALLFLRYKLKGTQTKVGRDVLTVIDGCYRENSKYWEAVYMVRRLVISVAYVFIIDERCRGHLLETICLLCLCGLTLLNGQVEDTDERYYIIIQVLILVPILLSLVLVVEKFAGK